jgi:dihydrofolate reductase
MNKFFPIRFERDYDSVAETPVINLPWGVISSHIERARKNHSNQDLETLAAKGGLTPCEALCIIEDRILTSIPEKEAVVRLNRIISAQKKNHIFMIAAMGENRVIGNKGKIPWRIPEDMHRFKTITYNHPVIMGIKTYESIGKILYSRKNIILTRSEKSSELRVSAIKNERSRQERLDSRYIKELAELKNGTKTHDQIPVFNGLLHRWEPNVEVCDNIKTALALSRSMTTTDPYNRFPFVIGGREVYKQFMPLATKLFITLVHCKPEGDVKFPTIKSEEFVQVSKESCKGDPNYTFLIFDRIKK